MTWRSDEEIFVITKVKNTVILMENKLLEPFTKNNCKKKQKKKNQKEFRIEKLIKRKGNKLYAKWEGYDNLFNSWWIKKP